MGSEVAEMATFWKLARKSSIMRAYSSAIGASIMLILITCSVGHVSFNSPSNRRVSVLSVLCDANTLASRTEHYFPTFVFDDEKTFHAEIRIDLNFDEKQIVLEIIQIEVISATPQIQATEKMFRYNSFSRIGVGVQSIHNATSTVHI